MVIGDEHKKGSRDKTRTRDCECGRYSPRKSSSSSSASCANDQVPINPPAMTDGEVREALFQMSQAITTQSQAIKTQANIKVVPRENQHVSTMARQLRDFTRMNSLMLFGSKVDENPKISWMRSTRSSFL